MALKFEEPLVQDAIQPLTCDFCSLTLKVLQSNKDFEAKQEALEELKTIYSDKKFDFNLRHTSSGSSGCLTHLIKSFKSGKQRMDDLSLFEDFVLD